MDRLRVLALQLAQERGRFVHYALAKARTAVVICVDEFGPLNLQPQPGGEAQFRALRYFTLAGTDHPDHATQAARLGTSDRRDLHNFHRGAMPLKPARVQARRDPRASSSPPDGPERQINPGRSTEAKVKTDTVDAELLAQLLAVDYLPGAWLADEETHALRRQVARRVVRQRTRLKNQVQSILHRNLVPRCPAADLFGQKGRRWLAEHPLPDNERQAIGALLRQLDFHGQELRIIDAKLSRVALARAKVKRLMTIPDVDATVALSIVAAVGDFARSRTPEMPEFRTNSGSPRRTQS